MTSQETTSLASTLAAIDAATGCQQCEGPLGGSPSDEFCSEACQRLWHSAWSARPLQPEAFRPVIHDLVFDEPRYLDSYFAFVMSRYAYSLPAPALTVRITGV